MKPEITILEEDPFVTINIHFYHGESASFFFFAEPENDKERAIQKPWRDMQQIFRCCFEMGHNARDAYVEFCMITSKIFVFVMATLIASFMNPAVGLLLGELLFILLLMEMVLHWNNKKVRDMQSEWLHTVRAKLYSFIDQNDYPGAIRYVYEIS